MQINEIEAFVAICELGSFRAAAEQIHLTQPAISKRLSTLEQRIGHRLFDRVGRGSVLTEAGHAYLPHARKLLMEVENSRRALDNLSANISGRLGLALSHHIALHRIPPVLKQYMRDYPEVNVEIEFLGSETACQAIANGQLDLAIITLPEPPLSGLDQCEIWRDPLQIFVAETHPLANASGITPQGLADWPALLPDESTYTYHIIAQALRPFGVIPQLRQTSNYLETLKMLTSIGLGWTALPASMAGPELVALDFPDLKLRRSLGTVRHPKRSLSNAAKAFMERLVTEELSLG